MSTIFYKAAWLLSVSEVEVPPQSLESQVLKVSVQETPEALKSVNIGKLIDPSGKNLVNFEGGFPDRARRLVWLSVNYATATLRLS